MRLNKARVEGCVVSVEVESVKAQLHSRLYLKEERWSPTSNIWRLFHEPWVDTRNIAWEIKPKRRALDVVAGVLKLNREIHHMRDRHRGIYRFHGLWCSDEALYRALKGKELRVGVDLAFRKDAGKGANFGYLDG